jgi:hypothetical protein
MSPSPVNREEAHSKLISNLLPLKGFLGGGGEGGFESMSNSVYRGGQCGGAKGRPSDSLGDDV